MNTNQVGKDTLIACIIFLVVYLCHASSSVITSYDSRWAILTARSIIQEGNLDLSEYDDILKKNNNYCIHEREGRKYNLFPIGTPLLSLPFVLAFDIAPSSVSNFVPGSSHIKSDPKVGALNAVSARLPLERAIASIFVALTAVIIYFIGRRWLNHSKATLLSVVFAFGTSSWSTASRGLWQHGPSMMLLSLSLLLMLNREVVTKRALLLGIILAFAYIVRPTNSISFVTFAIYLGLNNYRLLLRFSLGGLLILIPFFILNFNVYNSFLPPYFSAERISITSHFLEALLGNWISPARGLLIFSPIFILSFWGALQFLRRSETKHLSLVLISTIILHWIAISSYPQWWGGHSYGPRLFSDMLPFFCFFLIPYLERFCASFVTISIWALLLSVSVFIHYRGANIRSTQAWNTTPDSIDDSPERLWDYKNLQFLR